MYTEKTFEIPQYIADGFARMLLPQIQDLYENEEGEAYFEKWSAEQTAAETDEVMYDCPSLE